MSALFIRKPVYAWILALSIFCFGLASVPGLSVTRYPAVAPPSVTVAATYPGASAEAVRTAVTQVLEQRLGGLSGLAYVSSSSLSTGQSNITATFAAGVDPDAAVVRVQQNIQSVTNLLPLTVQRQGVGVAKAMTNRLLVLALYDATDRMSSSDIADLVADRLEGPLSHVDGVGDLAPFGAQHALRIWLDADKLRGVSLMPSDVRAAVLAQNSQAPAGQIGAQPALASQRFSVTVSSQSLLQTPEQFKAIVLHAEPNGALVRLGDVARVEIGSDDYGMAAEMNGHPASGVSILLDPAANGLATAARVKALMRGLSAHLPAGLKVSYPVDSTTVVKLSIAEVLKTLVIAVVLVTVVIFLFLQDWRAALIPVLAIPVVVSGTIGLLALCHYSVNILSLFGIVLVIGLLVDDAIVVVENVKRLMVAESLSATDATRRSMHEISGALTGIGVVLISVLAPLAAFPGATGVIYRQFAFTMIAAIALSVLVALTLTPALCVTLLRAQTPTTPRLTPFLAPINLKAAQLRSAFNAAIANAVDRPALALVIYFGVLAILGVLWVRLPTGFLPPEDEGAVVALVQGPSGSMRDRTLASLHEVARYFKDHERATQDVFGIAGAGLGGSTQNAGTFNVLLKDWKDRRDPKDSAAMVAERAMAAFANLPDAIAFAVVAPVIPELGASSGFDIELENRGGLSRADFMAARNGLIAAASKDPDLLGVRPVSPDDAPQLDLKVDEAKSAILGLQPTEVMSTIAAAWVPEYLNQFVDQGRIKRVYMEGDAAYRSSPDDLGRWTVRSAAGTMTPISAVASTSWRAGPVELDAYNGFPSLELQGVAAKGKSTGAAMKAMERLLKRLPPEVGYEWTGLSLQQEQAKGFAPKLYAASLIVILITLAVLYESWSVPLVIVAVFPLALLGAVAATALRGLDNDIYFQVGLLTTLGLAAKNAILIVEFALLEQKRGLSARAAALKSANERLRPILMTSIAFVAGVLPLAFAEGAGSGSQRAIGTCVVGGMLSATILVLYFTPLMFARVRERRETSAAPAGDAAPKWSAA